MSIAMQERGSSNSDLSLLPRATGRSNSVVGGKPVHLHRVIKDRSNSVVVTPTPSVSDKRHALVPIGNASAIDNVRGSIDGLVQGGPSGLLKLEKISASENDTKEFLRRRIKELEKEVAKLNHHIHQAEMSIKNYRVSLSEKSPRIGFGTGRECGIQTDPDDTTELQTSLKATQDKLLATVEELRAVKAAKDAMFNERKQLSEASKRKEEFLLNTIQTNEDRLAQQTARIRDLEAQLQNKGGGSAAAVGRQSDSDKILESMLGALTETQKLRTELATIKRKLAADSQAMMLALASDYRELWKRAETVRDATRTATADSHGDAAKQQQAEQMTCEMALLRAQLQESHDQCTTLRTECAKLKSDNSGLRQTVAASVRESAEKCTNTEPRRTTCDASTSTPGSSPLSTPTKPVPPPAVETTPAHSALGQDAVCSPLSPLAGRSYSTSAAAAQAAAIQADLHTQTKLRLAETEAELAGLQARADRDRALLVQQSADLDALKQRLLSERERYDAICREQESRLAQRSTEAAGHQQRADALQQRLGQATHALASLQEVHAAEVKAVRHEAHVRDLQRVAKEREADIEKDRLQIELKHIKEVQNILTFSLSTAEQSLNEVLPHVVVKLAQGREKRLKLLEQTTNGRRRDLEQRSADTCAVNTAHLEAFQQKAAKNNAAAQEMTHAATKRLLGLLQLEGPPPPSGIQGPAVGTGTDRATDADKGPLPRETSGNGTRC